MKALNGLYQVSSLGRVRSLDRIASNGKAQNGKERFRMYKGRMIKPTVNQNRNSLKVTLSNCKKIKQVLLHRLVAKTFLKKNINKNDIVLFRDNNYKNCNINNLYIITKKEWEQKLLNSGKIVQKQYEYYGGKVNMKEFSRLHNINYSTIKSRVGILNWNIYECEMPVQKIKGVNY